ncbi:MAG: hypothetical protein ACYDDF_15110 [Thermoplasmatota archaeon]
MNQEGDPSTDLLALRAFRIFETRRGHHHAAEVTEFDCILATIAHFRAQRYTPTSEPAEAPA